MTSITFTKIVTRFGETLANDIPVLRIPSGQIVCFVGPSGCGKTTALRTIAGLVTQDEGELAFGDRIVTDVPPEARNAAMVFQNYALFPHMTVAENVGFGLSVRHRPAEEIVAKVAEVLDLVQLPDVGSRYPRQLSGGQQQRIAVARALATEPDILLFDEPLSNLDAKLREDLRFELRQLLERLKVTTVYVTHDQTEAMVIGDRMVVMKEGRIVQDGPPAEVYRRPASRFVADFLGASSFIEGTVSASDGSFRRLDTADGFQIWGVSSLAEGSPAAACLRPDAVHLHQQATRNQFAGEVLGAADLGDVQELTLAIGGHRLRARADARALLDPGSPVTFHIETTALHDRRSGHMTLRTISYNTQYCTGLDKVMDPARIATEVAHGDIIALQEVERHWNRTGDVDQVAALGEALPDRYWVYGAGYDTDASTVIDGRVQNRRRQFGNMILSRWPILMSRNHILPKLNLVGPMSLQRSALEAVIDTPIGALRVFSVHLAHAAAPRATPADRAPHGDSGNKAGRMAGHAPAGILVPDGDWKAQPFRSLPQP